MANAISEALELHALGYTPVPVRRLAKAPYIKDWQHLDWDKQAAERGCTVADLMEELFAPGDNVGILLGEPSDRLIDIDFDDDMTAKVARLLMPRTEMISGREKRPSTHYFYRGAGTAPLPGTVRLKDREGHVTVEYRTDGSQTLVAPSVHPSGDQYVFTGGVPGEPLEIDPLTLNRWFRLTHFVGILANAWPKEGSRHDAYLALAGGLLRGDQGGVHEQWRQLIGKVIDAIALVTGDNERDTRVREVVPTTLEKLRKGEFVQGWPTLRNVIGIDFDHTLKALADFEESIGWRKRMFASARDEEESIDFTAASKSDLDSWVANAIRNIEEIVSSPDFDGDPTVLRPANWSPINMSRAKTYYRDLPPKEPTLLPRTDGKCTVYDGVINFVVAPSEAGKSFIVIGALALEAIRSGKKVCLVDFEDSPRITFDRLEALGAYDEISDENLMLFTPTEPLGGLWTDNNGRPIVDDGAAKQRRVWDKAIDEFNPDIIVIDGFNALLGIHGKSQNEMLGVNSILAWARELISHSRTVIIIDHTNKNAKMGDGSGGSGHKKALVQGVILQAHVVKQPVPTKGGHVQLFVVKDRIGQLRRHCEYVEVGDAGEWPLAAEVFFDYVPRSVAVPVSPVFPDGVKIVEGVDLRVEPPTDKTVSQGSQPSYADPKERAANDLADRIMHVAENLIAESGGEVTNQWWAKSTLLSPVPISTHEKDQYWRDAIKLLLDTNELISNGRAGAQARYSIPGAPPYATDTVF